MTGCRMPARSTGATSPGVTVGTVGTGPKASDEVFSSESAPGVLASGPTGMWPTCTASNASVAVGLSPPSRSVEAVTRLETRTKESNMCTSHWVD